MKIKRNTKQKQIIFGVIREMKTHPTAAELYDELKNRGYDIGKSTIYRVLADAVDEGLIENVFTDDRQEHFDGNIEKHYHIICKNCGRIYDSHMSYDPVLNELGKQADIKFQILDHRLEFYGVCPECE